MSFPKISIVVVNFNLAVFLEETLLSIINQNYSNLELILIDGGSTDGSLDIIRKYENNLTYWISEPDSGQYEALMKGFAKSTGEIMAWINSDDLYYPNSLKAVAEIFSDFSEVKWLSGFPTEYNINGTGVNRITLPWARWSKWRYYTWDFQFIEQESCFWRRTLWEKAGSNLDVNLKLAGDLVLWARFFRHEKLFTTTALLAGFRYRGGSQRSKMLKQDYLDECKSILKHEIRQLPFYQKIFSLVLRVLITPFSLFWFLDLPLLRGIYRSIMGIPQIISWNFDSGKWVFDRNLIKMPPFFLFGKQVLNPFRKIK